MAIEFNGLPSAIATGNKDLTQTDKSNNDISRSQETPRPSSNDAVTLTANAEAMRSAEISVNTNSGIDQDRVNSLKQAIDAGKYAIDPLRVAEKFLKFESELMAG